MGVNLKSYLSEFPTINQRKFGRSYDFQALQKRFLPLREGQRWLAASDVAELFCPDNTPFAKYWPQPNEKDLDKILSAKHLLLGPHPAEREQLLLGLLSVFHNLGIASIILRFVHPDRYGVLSTPVLHLLQVNRSGTVELYLDYCEELEEWKNHFRLPSVAETEMAIWTLAETMKGARNGEDTATAAKNFEDDLWIQRRRVSHVVRPFLRRYGRLQLARILLDEDARLAGKIAAEEYERLLGIASQRICGRPLLRKKGAAESLIDELERRKKVTLPQKAELRRIWETRNAVIHPGEPASTREAVEVMIDRIFEICSAWEKA